MKDLRFEFGGADGFFGDDNRISFEQVTIFWDAFFDTAGMDEGDDEHGP